MSNYLCEELIVEIFTRLPVKSLLRFRSVSKWLYACIGSRRFIRLHAFRSPNKVMIKQQVERQGRLKSLYTLHSGGQLTHDHSNTIEAVEYPFPTLLIVGSCNGILCIYGCSRGVYLFNPSIRRKVTVFDRPSWAHSVNQFLTLGFGFDPVIDDYKLLKIVNTRMTEKRYVQSASVYTIKMGTWREIALPPTCPFTCMNSSQCLFNGSLYWLVIWYLTDSWDQEHSHVYMLKFDLSSDVFSRIELPVPTWETNQVTIIKGCLAVISTKHDHTWIWVRKECNASWFAAFKLNTHEFKGLDQVFQLNANEDLLLHPDFRRIIVYNPETRKRSKYGGLNGSFKTSLHMTVCVESLELLDVGTPCDQGEVAVKGKKEKSHTTCKFM